MEAKPPAAVIVHISMDGRHDSGAASPLSTTTSFLQGRMGCLAIVPKQVELVIGPSRTLCAVVQLSPRIACTAVAAPCMRSRVLVFAGPSISMARRGCRASCSRHAESCSKSLVILSHLISCCFKAALYTIDPRSPFFAFCTPKYSRLQKCG